MNKLLATIMVLGLSSSAAFAQTPEVKEQPKQGERMEMRQQMKEKMKNMSEEDKQKMIAEKIQKRIEHHDRLINILDSGKACLQSAKTREDLHKCEKAEHQSMKNLREEHKEHRKHHSEGRHLGQHKQK